MPINIDGCEKCAVAVRLDTRNMAITHEIDVCFSRFPDKDVFRELETLCQRPGFHLLDTFSKRLIWEVVYPPTWDGKQIAEAIAVCFEKEHGLRVTRLISDPEDENDCSAKKLVASFCF
jgi:hypothetical protein